MVPPCPSTSISRNAQATPNNDQACNTQKN